MKIDDDLLTWMYRKLYTIRLFETRCINLYRKGLIYGYFHPYLGEEAIAVGVCAALGDRDYLTSTHRGHGHSIARGASLEKMAAELMGKDTGYCKGRGGSMHIADVSKGILGANGIVGAGIPIAVGAALGISIEEIDAVAVCFCSDGASNNGVFAESLNLASIWDLPLILVIENNQYAVSSPIKQMSRTEDLYCRAAGYGIEASAVDGNDVIKVFEKTRDAVSLCKQGQGPVVIEAKTYRHMGHHVNDPGNYMPQETLDYYKQEKDPVAVGRDFLCSRMHERDVIKIESLVEAEIDKAVDIALKSPVPDPVQFTREIEGL